MSTWFLAYSRPLPHPAEMSIAMLASGVTELTLTGEPIGVQPGHDAIGLYRDTLPPEQVERLRQLILAALDESSQGESIVDPGTPLLEFGVGQGTTIERLVSVSLGEPLPPACARFDQAMIDLIRAMLKHPQRTLKGTGSWERGVLSPDEEIRFRLLLTNSGRDEISIPNPAAKSKGEWFVRVQIEPDRPLGEIQTGDRVYLDLTSEEFGQLGQDGRVVDRPRPLVHLAPGEKLELAVTVRHHVFLKVGRYRIAVTYESTTSKAKEDESVDGLLRLHMPILEIARTRA